MACEVPAPVPVEDTLVPGEDSQVMSGFSWVVDNALAGMPQPGARAMLDDDLAFLKEQGVDLIVSANLEGIDTAAAAAYGMAHVRLPVEDFGAPTMVQMSSFASLAGDRIADGGRVAVHCTAGMGRTGTYLAVWFVSDGMRPEQAIAHVREKRPGSIESASQEAAIHTFWRSRVDAMGAP